MINDFFNLLFPKNCGACEMPLLVHEGVICTSCAFHLPRTNSHLENNSELHQLFWGRIKLEKTLAMFHYEKQSKVQHLIHNLKYRGQTSVGVGIGEMYGKTLLPFMTKDEFDFILPVPLSDKKFRQRGYNQVDYFADGLSNSLSIPVNKKAMIRNEGSISQTSKSRFERWENVQHEFHLLDSHNCKNKSIILVDDVITTGATLEACAKPLLALGCKLSVMAMAFTKR